MESFVYSEINLMSIVVCLIIALKVIFSRNNKDNRNIFLFSSVCSCIVVSLADIIWKLDIIRATDFSVSFLTIVNVAYFTFFTFATYFLFWYFEITSKRPGLEDTRKVMISFVPLILQVTLIFASVNNGCVFYYDANMNYQRGSLFAVEQLLMYGYPLYTALRCIYDATVRNNYIRRERLFKFALWLLPIFVCGVIEHIYPNAPVAPLGLVLSYLLIYINALQRLISHDALTGINNRGEILKKLEEKISSLKKNERLYFLFIDIDSFKEINDTYGHFEGDCALQVVSSILSKVAKERDGICARYGGDEFALLFVFENNEKIDTIIRRIYTLVNEKSMEQNLAYSISVSIGCAQYNKDAFDIQGLVSYADNDMYNVKKEKNLVRNK